MTGTCREIVGALSSAMYAQDIKCLEYRSFREESFKTAMGLICSIENLDLKDRYLRIYEAVRIYCAWQHAVDRSELGGTQVRFQQMLSSVLPGASITKAPPIKDRKRPDFWVLSQGTLMPVEVKCGNFDKKALKQLLNYMTVYGVQRGIAVAPCLTVELPESIQFVAVN